MTAGLSDLVFLFLLVHVVTGQIEPNRTACLQIYQATDCVEAFSDLASGGANIQEQTDHLCGEACEVSLNEYRDCLGLTEQQKEYDDALFCGRYNGVYCTVLSREDPEGTATLAAVDTNCANDTNSCSEQCASAINNLNEVHGCCANGYSGIGGIPGRYESYYSNCDIAAPPIGPCSAAVSVFNGAASLLVTVIATVAIMFTY